METKTGNRVMKIQTDFSAMGPTIFELWVMKIKNPNSPLVCSYGACSVSAIQLERKKK